MKIWKVTDEDMDSSIGELANLDYLSVGHAKEQYLDMVGFILRTVCESINDEIGKHNTSMFSSPSLFNFSAVGTNALPHSKMKFNCGTSVELVRKFNDCL